MDEDPSLPCLSRLAIAEAENARLLEALDAIHGIACVTTVGRVGIPFQIAADIERIVNLCVPHLPTQET
jgi:hypothetical protein